MDQWRLLDVAALDTRLAQIAHRRSTLPEAGELSVLEQRARTLRDELVAAETEAGDAARELAKAEADVELVRTRAARDRARLESGQGSHKDLESLQHELESLARRQSALEDVELEIMERHEGLTDVVERLTGERDGLQADVDAVTARRDAALRSLQSEAEQLAGQRVGMVAGLDAALLAVYEKNRAGGGPGAALLRQRRCEGCRMEQTSQDMQKIRAAADDDVVRCEECSGILVRTGESGL